MTKREKTINRIILCLLFICFTLVISGLSIIFSGQQNNELQLIFCDVGQGDAILFVAGQQQMLIDGGPDNGKALSCLRKYMPSDDSRLELLVITHPDLDHFGGLTTILDVYQVETVIIPPFQKNTISFNALKQKLMELVANQNLNLIHCPGKTKMSWPGDSQISFWNTFEDSLCGTEPAKTETKNNVLSDNYFWYSENNDGNNNGSIVTILNIDQSFSLFLGDLETAGELALIRSKLLTKIDVLKIAHHGAKTATSDELLLTLRPEKAVISVGKSNRYGHPTRQTLSKLEVNKIPIYRTDEIGDVVFVFQGSQWQQVAKEQSWWLKIIDLLR